ncbi:SOS response-associated peptidase [Sneathiella sp.]|jgi:putative SOS response-associated peptidase YedK|uniref:SOS response-associated peptidase n=1 Tax=Sneathiella sp. TaxID=1964365 RepID=UPI0039E677B8
MCARFSISSPLDMLRTLFSFSPDFHFSPSYNIAPGSQVPIIRQDIATGKAVVSIAQWGLIPGWSDVSKPRSNLINARLETIDVKPSFKRAFAGQRCLIPCTGYYEWKTDSLGEKQPYLIFSAPNPLFFFAGLWDKGSGPQEHDLDCCTIVTTEATGTPAEIHSRMPLTVTRDYFKEWLGGIDRTSVPVSSYRETFTYYPVHKKVGNVRYNTADLIKKIDLDEQPSQGSLF